MAKFEEVKTENARYPHIVMLKPRSRAIQYDKDGNKQEGYVTDAETFIPLPERFLDVGSQSLSSEQWQTKMQDAQYFSDYLESLKKRGFRFVKFGECSTKNRFVAAVGRILEDVAVKPVKKAKGDE